jgi:hypothetical protein
MALGGTPSLISSFAHPALILSRDCGRCCLQSEMASDYRKRARAGQSAILTRSAYYGGHGDLPAEERLAVV